MHIQVITQMHAILVLVLHQNVVKAPLISLAKEESRRCNMHHIKR